MVADAPHEALHKHSGQAAVLPVDRDNGQSPRWTRPLRFHLSFIIIALLVVVSTILIGYNFHHSRQAALDAAVREMRIRSEHVQDRGRAVVRAASEAVNLASRTQIVGSSDAANPGRLVSFLKEVLGVSEYIDSVYIGFPTGGFVDVVNIENNPAWQRTLAAPPDAVTAVRMITTVDQGRVSDWRFLGRDGGQLAATATEPADYDPRPRPWYKAARETPDLISTAPYRMATTGAYGMTLARRSEADPAIVFGVDLLFQGMGAFLTTELVTPRSHAYLFDASNHIIAQANTGPGDPMSDADGEALAEKISATLGSIAQAESKTARLSVHEGDYLVSVLRLTGGRLLKDGYLAHATPIVDLTRESDRLLVQGLVVSLMVLAIGIGFAVLVANRIGRSLVGITSQARRMQLLELGPTVGIESRISEVDELAKAVAAAGQTISAFSLYVPKELVRRIITSGEFTGRSGHRQTVTALFSDIKDFTSICEQCSAEDVVSMLSRYFDLFSEIIKRHDGVIIQFSGDAVFALWNAPQVDVGHADHACRCALDLKSAIDAFNAGQRQNRAPQCTTRFGVHTGTVVVGSVGAEDRFQYTAMGDAINVAARLEGLNKEFGTTILVSGDTAALMRSQFALRPLGRAKVKGRGESVSVFELTG